MSSATPASGLPSGSPLMSMPTYTQIYRELESTYNLTRRDSQQRLSELTRDAIAKGSIVVVEAPTGTGKTIGYLAGALDAMAHMANPIPIVVATATVGLQEQILRYDIPRLAKIGALEEKHVAVAKGRGRYFCPRTTSLLEDKKMQDSQTDMFSPEKHVAGGGVTIALDMLKKWRDKEWDGDRDSWEGAIPSCWAEACGASSETCVNRACEHFEVCPYMLSRHRLGQAKLIVANHDLVLADLAQRAEEQQQTTLPAQRYAIIFDEAHNLPKKATKTKQAEAVLARLDWLRKLESYGERVVAIGPVAIAMSKASGYGPEVFTLAAGALQSDLQDFAKELQATYKIDMESHYSWGLKEPDTALLNRVANLAGQALSILLAFQTVSKALADHADNSSGPEKSFAVRMLAETRQNQHKIEELHKGLELFCSGEKLVRWLYLTKKQELSLHTEPLEAAQVLQALLWKKDFPVILTSATLQIAGSFKRFLDKCGLSHSTFTEALPPVFDYSRGYLHMPSMYKRPGESGFDDEMVAMLTKVLKVTSAKGLLVLFTSRETLRSTIGKLPEEFRECILAQDARPVPELIAQHKDRIDRGLTSILFGLDTMSEGLDLPGAYCEHVIITRLPFEVPGEPVEIARRDALGPAVWFQDAYLADMLTKLIQAVGRLIRREDDYGVVTVLDKRLWTKRYSGLAMKALPRFERVHKLKLFRDAVDRLNLKSKKPRAPVTITQESTTPNASTKTPAAKGYAGYSRNGKPAAPRVAPAMKDNIHLTTATETASQVAYPADQLGMLYQPDAPTRAGLDLTEMSLDQAMGIVMPALAKKPHSQLPDYLPLPDAQLCLPAGSPVTAWAELQMPQAVMLGLYVCNITWPTTAPVWHQMLLLRADLLQFAQILRSHHLGIPDSRCTAITLEECCVQLNRGFAKQGLVSLREVLPVVDRIEHEVTSILSSDFIPPTKELLGTLPQLANTLSRYITAK